MAGQTVHWRHTVAGAPIARCEHRQAGKQPGHSKSRKNIFPGRGAPMALPIDYDADFIAGKCALTLKEVACSNHNVLGLPSTTSTPLGKTRRARPSACAMYGLARHSSARGHRSGRIRHPQGGAARRPAQARLLEGHTRQRLQPSHKRASPAHLLLRLLARRPSPRCTWVGEGLRPGEGAQRQRQRQPQQPRGLKRLTTPTRTPWQPGIYFRV